MEDGPNGVLSEAEEPLPNGVASAAPRVNGEVDQASECSSESDALVIDEGPRNIVHYNPYFNESLFELSQQHRRPQKSPKLREYAQYLGLQPTVQFKCWRCGRAGFESLTTLNAHIGQCSDEAPAPQAPERTPNSFKLTRKVFLCSACGTYYENWNLYLHMLEVHRRYLCLYCLGMFSVLDDLCVHIQSRHHHEPGHKDTLDDFFSTYSEPCYILCCECHKLFNEQDNFFYHTCARKDGKTKVPQIKGAKPPKPKPLIKPENHITGDSFDVDTNDVPVNHSDLVSSDEEGFDLRGFSELGEAIFRGSTPPVEEIEAEAAPEPEIPEPEPEVTENMEVETRKVPKLSLKLKPGAFPEIASEEPELEQMESENENEIEENHNTSEDKSSNEIEEEVIVKDEIQLAGDDVEIIPLELENPLDKFDIRVLLQKCLNSTAPTCIYCNHARKIAVNGKQLGLHAIAQHRFSAIVHSITAEELIPESFVARIKECLPELESVFFSLESDPTNEAVTFSHIFECFQCRYSTSVHKELYLHNRKLHTKNLLLCIMCKSNFYSYSELICHLCPGEYNLDYDVAFRCCMCVGDDLPSAFRLMVHLRKRHHVCDVCLEMCHNQYRLSNHVWKHKLHHFCYRCGIAYRNKPDITRHLFWKHGTESVLCKKCLQKKWPHVYHFCVPPVSFVCEECNLNFSRAVSLKVHKRIHSDEKPHACTVEGCEEKFISKKLLAKHDAKHNEPPPEEKVEEESLVETKPEVPPEPEEKVEEKKKVDVYDLPALNLSESDSSDSEDEGKKAAVPLKEEEVKEDTVVEEPAQNEVVIDDIWDNFKTYQANKEKLDHMFNEADKIEIPEPEPFPEVLTLEAALRDHDYCVDPENKPDISFTEVKPDLSQSVDHDYCFSKETGDAKEPKSPKPVEKVQPVKNNTSSSDSSSDSDSSCSCGPNCSCSSSSGSSSSSSDSSNSDSSTEEGRKRQQLRRDKRRQRKNKPSTSSAPPPVVNHQHPLAVVPEMPIQESDLDTTESDTDEEFYDKQPQKIAKKLLEEKRNQLLAGIESGTNGSLLDNSRSATPNLPEELSQTKKKKSKSKKKKKKKNRESRGLIEERRAPYYQYYQPPTVAPLTLTLTRNSPIPSPSGKHDSELSEADGSTRASKRRRVPNKFYGYSSDEEEGASSTPKWRKSEPPLVHAPPPLMVPPLTIKTVPPSVPPLSIRMPPMKLKPPKVEDVDSEAESNDSSNEGRNMLQVNPDALYCYCKCPYDEVSEMIGCDSRDCNIEWFHFECVGIMVPPKGHWYCPECRKKRQQKREMLKLKAKAM